MMPKVVRKLALLVLLVVVCTCLATGCSAEQTPVPGEGERLVTDCLDRQVIIPTDPQSIAGLDPFAAQLIIMLGQGEKLTSTVGGIQRDTLLQQIRPGLANISVAKSSGVLNVEELLRLGTELVFLKEDDYANRTEMDKLEQAGIPYLVISYDSMAGQQQTALMIGEALGAEEKAAQYAAYYQEAVARAAAWVAEVPEALRPRVYHSVTEAVRTDAVNSLGADWIAVTGALNVSVGEELNVRDGDTYCTLEQIFVWDPDLIICNGVGVPEYILSDEKWRGLRAVVDEQVYQIPIGVSRWGHFSSTETPLAIFWLIDLLYPQYATELDLLAEMDYFYATFYEFGLDAELKAQILSGEGLRTPSPLTFQYTH